MSEFEDYIKARYPVDYDSLKEKYPNVHVCEFYGDEQDLWDLKQAEIDDSENTRAVLYRENTDIREKNTDLQAKIELLKRLIEIKDRVRDEQQAKIDDLEKQLDMMKYINDEQSKNIQNAFKTIEIEQGFKDELQKRIDAVKAIMNEYYTGSFDESAEMAGLISLALRGEHE